MLLGDRPATPQVMRSLVAQLVEPTLRSRGFEVSVDETDNLVMVVAYVKGPTAP
jgi:hypothetical protein